jgi:hypothetical protein
MKPFLLTLLAALCLLAATAEAQTVKALAYNTTNDAVVATQRITFSRLGLSGSTAATPALTFAVGTNTLGLFATTQVGIGSYLGASVDGARRFYLSTNTIRAELAVSFSDTNVAATTRTNLGLPLPALTNTSNVTTMRALAGSTNTNAPFSGSVSVVGTNNTNTLVFTNGILLEVATP